MLWYDLVAVIVAPPFEMGEPPPPFLAFGDIDSSAGIVGYSLACSFDSF